MLRKLSKIYDMVVIAAIVLSLLMVLIDFKATVIAIGSLLTALIIKKLLVFMFSASPKKKSVKI